jgi:hypothetical protein
MNRAVKWEDALKITEVKNVEDALHAFKDSPSEDNAVGLAQYIIETYLQQKRDHVALMHADTMLGAGDLHADAIELAQERTQNPALKRGREMWAALLADGRRFRILAHGLTLTAVHTEDNDALLERIEAVADEIVTDDVQPSLGLMRTLVDTLYARGLLKEIEDDTHNDKAAG